jgi:PAS domain S-box-containing protein
MNTPAHVSVAPKPLRSWRSRQLSVPDWMIAGTSLFIILNGLSVWIGWWTQTRILVQLFVDDAPTHFNTALGFILLAVAELGVVLRRRRLVLCAAGALIFVAVVELAEWALGVDLGVDALFAFPFIGADAPYPGRMSANTAVCFLLVGAAQLLMLKRVGRADEAHTAAVMLKSIAGGIAFIALLGYIIKLNSAYGWSQSVGMGVRSWAGFLLIVIAEIAALWKHDILDQSRLPRWFLPFLGIAVISISAGLIWIFNSPAARPFSVDPLYAANARRISLVIEFCVGTLITLGAISVVVAQRKALMALRHAEELGVQISRRAEAERELRSNSQSLVEQAKILDLAQVIVRDPAGRIMSWSLGSEKLYGYTREEAIGSISHVLLRTIFPVPLADIEAQLLRTGVWEGELSHRTRDGRQIDVASVWVLHADAEGNSNRILESNTDVTERRRAEHKLADQLARLNLLSVITRSISERLDLPSIFQVVIRTLEDQLPVDFGCLCLYQPPDVLTVVGIGINSHQLAIDIGLTEQARVPIDANGLSRCVGGQLVYEPDLRGVRFAFPQRLAAAGLHAMVAAPLMLESKVFGVLIVARHAADSFSSGECEFLGQLSEHVAVAAHQTQLYSALEVAYEDLRKTQQAVMRQEKLRVLGQMASGIAHDINNALSPASLYVELLIERESGDEATKEYLMIIHRAIEGVAQTVARMKEFYSQRDAQLAHVPLSVNEAVEQVIDLTRARWNAMPQESGRVIEVKSDLANDLPAIAGNFGEIRDAITNLILNAADAMPEGGLLTLRSRTVGLGSVELEVTDTGVGMDEETRSHCLELFFTTKGARGTGLGLAMVYGTVERHGGEIQIDSKPGAGTTFRLIFPAASASQVSTGATPAPPRPQRPLHILVVDDDPIILKSMLDLLEQDGHVVEVADGGQRGIDAFRAAEARGESFAVVVTDLGMPYVDGKVVAEAVKAVRPGIPVVLLTGWGHRILAENNTIPNVDRVLGKPPKLALLRSVLAELTNGIPTSGSSRALEFSSPLTRSA